MKEVCHMGDNGFSKAEHFILRLVLLLALVIESAQLLYLMLHHFLAILLVSVRFLL